MSVDRNEGRYLEESPEAESSMPFPRLKRPIPNAQDYLSFVNRAVISASKDPRAFETPKSELDAKAIKWLRRAEASIYRKAKMILDEQEYYKRKMQEASTAEDRERAQRKMNSFAPLSYLPSDPDLIKLVEEIRERYVRDAEYYFRKLTEQRSNHLVSASKREQTREDYDVAVYMVNVWDNPKMTSAQASDRARLELINYAKAARDNDTPQNQWQMHDFATSAIAWAIRARNVKAEEERRSASRAQRRSRRTSQHEASSSHARHH